MPLLSDAGRRFALSIATVALLLGAWRHPGIFAGQGAQPFGNPGHEDLTFWVRHSGLIELDFEGEAGFGDLARVLMRRRGNASALAGLRDRFVFQDRDPRKLDLPGVVRAETREGKSRIVAKPERVILGAGRTFNLPLLWNSGQVTTGHLIKVRELSVGQRMHRVRYHDLDFDLPVEVRPLVPLTVHLKDADGAPVPARVYLTAADGLAYAPRGSIPRFAALAAEPYFHSEPSFTIELPAGSTLIEAIRGTEYQLARSEITLEPGRPQEITLTLTRWTNARAGNWYSGDLHVHANYTAPHHQSVRPEDVALLAKAEDLQVTNLMVANSSGSFLHDRQFFEGAPHSLSTPGALVYFNEEMRNAGLYGHMCFFGLKKLVEPVYTGFRDTPNWADYPPNYTQAKAARDQGAVVTYAHPGYQATLEGASARELPVDLALGEVDAMDLLSNNPEEVAQELYHRLLNSGFRLGVSAGTDAFLNVADHYLPGGGRVYAKVEGGFSWQKWRDAMRAHRTFVTNGPMLELTVEGAELGQEIRRAAPGSVSIQAEVQTRVPLDVVEVLVNGKPSISKKAVGTGRIDISSQVTLTQSSWIALRAVGPRHRLVVNDTAAFAHTSPVWVTIGNKPVRVSEDAQFYAGWIGALLDRVEQRGQFATDEQKREVQALFEKARREYLRRAQDREGEK